MSTHSPVTAAEILDADDPIECAQVRSIWAEPANREFMSDRVCRWLSKNGDFYLSEQLLDRLGRCLDVADLVALYLYLRDNSQRLEIEWRAEFIARCPTSSAALPEITHPLEQELISTLRTGTDDQIINWCNELIDMQEPLDLDWNDETDTSIRELQQRLPAPVRDEILALGDSPHDQV